VPGVEGLSISTGDGHDLVDAHAAGIPVNVSAGLHNARSTFIGGSGNDFFFGSDANDVLIGNGGNDFFVAFAGHNVMSGGTGYDVFQLGSGGNDTIATGAGNDRIEIVSAAHETNHAEITDFNVKHDTIASGNIVHPDYAKLDTNHDGKLDAGDATVHVNAHGLTVDLSPVLFTGHETLAFDHLSSVPLDVLVG
jgi:Ca2+-binding RTX toxin-like protein